MARLARLTGAASAALLLQAGHAAQATEIVMNPLVCRCETPMRRSAGRPELRLIMPFCTSMAHRKSGSSVVNGLPSLLLALARVFSDFSGVKLTHLDT